jgi:ADP-dependent NAD(P)H-hydrate dehydratase / NAD(P)H-hydrate epimerase
MRYAHTVTAVRDAEAPLLAGLPAGALMQRAVAGLVTHAARRLGRVYGARVVVLAGGGDNGGDALWAGARLAARGARVDALAPGRTHPDGTAALLAAGGRRHRFAPAAGAGARATATGMGAEGARELLARADLVLDGLLGIGGRGGLREPYATLAALAPPERTVAVDVPSGVDADTGAVAGAAVRATSTVTFGTYKPGLLLGAGAAYAGRVELVGIGLELGAPTLAALDEVDVAALLPRPGAAASKYTRGVLGLVAGSDAYPGAAVLAAGGALRGGAGYIRFVSEAGAARAVRAAHPEIVVTEVGPGDPDAVLAAGRVQAWAVGSGLPPDAATARVVAGLLRTDVPVLVDAGALGAAAADPGLKGRAAGTLLTPHEGEFLRLTADALGWDAGTTAAALAADRLGTARRAAADLGATILLKGNRTLIVEVGGRARVNTTGTPWLAAAGTGDVLTGLAGSLLAGGLDPFDAGSVAAYLHGVAGQRATPPVAASDLLASLGSAVRSVAGGVTLR